MWKHVYYNENLFFIKEMWKSRKYKKIIDFFYIYGKVWNVFRGLNYWYEPYVNQTLFTNYQLILIYVLGVFGRLLTKYILIILIKGYVQYTILITGLWQLWYNEYKYHGKLDSIFIYLFGVVTGKIKCDSFWVPTGNLWLFGV